MSMHGHLWLQAAARSAVEWCLQTCTMQHVELCRLHGLRVPYDCSNPCSYRHCCCLGDRTEHTLEPACGPCGLMWVCHPLPAARWPVSACHACHKMGLPRSSGIWCNEHCVCGDHVGVGW